MPMNLKHYIASAAFILALSGHASAQTISTESLPSPETNKTKILRFDGFYNKRDFSAIGFLDFLGKDFERYYGELYLRQNLRRNSGVTAEINGGSGFGPVYRAGYIADIPTPKGAYANIKFLPLNATGDRFLPQFQVGLFGHAELPGNFYLEDWTDYTIEKGAKPSFLTEFTAGKDVTKNFALQGQAAYNVGFPGWLFRAGFRYKLF